MNRSSLPLLAVVLAFTSMAPAAIRYVDINCATPTPPYTNWASAATNIQDAIDAASYPDEILVADGVYGTGGVIAAGTMTNRVFINKRVTVRSVNGPSRTIIQGAKSPSGTNGAGAIRCVAMSPYAVLSGFTLAGGATTSVETYARGGGVYCTTENEVITNCVLVGNSAAFRGGAAYLGTLQNCLILSNSAPSGGGVYGSTAENCTFRGNSAETGGGAYEAHLSNCLLNDNWGDRGGGAAGGGMDFCTLTGNGAKFGGGISAAGSASPSAFNCILYYNHATRDGDNWSSGSLFNCCTTPMPTNGSGNFVLDPQLASLSHLSSASPCRAAARQVNPIVTDIDGEPWANPASIGCDEYNTGSVTGALAVAISTRWTNFATGFSAGFRALIDGRTTASVWDFGDGTTVSNRPCANHAWSSSGDQEVVLTAYNESFPEGVSTRLVVRVSEPLIHYVALEGSSPAPPYTSWDTAAADIQSAVDVSLPGESIVVGDGVYARGGREVLSLTTNRVVVDKPLTIRSLNGPARTAIHGYQAVAGATGEGSIRCVWLTNNAILSGFTLAYGGTRAVQHDYYGGGGGAWCGSPSPVLENCVVVSNVTSFGGAVCGGTLNNCVVARNTGSPPTWSGASWSRLNNCTIVSNKGYAAYYGALTLILA